VSPCRLTNMFRGPCLPPPSGQRATRRYIPEDKAPIFVQYIPVIVPRSVWNYELPQPRRAQPVPLLLTWVSWEECRRKFHENTLRQRCPAKEQHRGQSTISGRSIPTRYLLFLHEVQLVNSQNNRQ